MDSEKEIIEGNKLIAEFMKIQTEKIGYYYNKEFYGGMAFAISEMKYHSSWDWLMPVVEKIEKLRVGLNASVCVEYMSNNQKFNFKIFDEFYNFSVVKAGNIENKLITIWEAVIEFIKWYNSQNEK